MVIEVEMKFAVRDEVELRQRLKKWEVELGPSERQSDSYFSHPARDFSNTDEALRIRQTESRVEVTYKGPVSMSVPRLERKSRLHWQTGKLRRRSSQRSWRHWGFA